MKRGLVVYGVSGIMEWNAIIPAGTARVNIPFKNGSYDGRGVSAATYRTTDPFFQAVIEHSAYFSSGKIFIIQDEREGDSDEPTEESEDVSELQKVEVPSEEDARQYLMEHFGFKGTALKSKRAILAAATANGVEFVFADEQ